MKQKIKENIIILGAGFAGVSTALTLNKFFVKDKNFRKNFNLILIDKNNYHLYTPTLYEAATTAKSTASGKVIKKVITIPIESIVKNSFIKFIQGKIAEIDLDKKSIKFTDGDTLNYSFLTIALGSEPEYFNIEGLKDYALNLKWLQDAIRIRDEIRKKFLEKENGDEIKILIGGSGPNGVEFSAEAKGYIKELNKIYNKKIIPKIILIDGAPNILPGFEDSIIKRASLRLKKLKIITLNNFIISKVDDRFVHLKKSTPDQTQKDSLKNNIIKKEYDVLIWAGGVRANQISKNINLKKDKRERLDVENTLNCIKKQAVNNVYIVGDMACVHDPQTKRPIPGNAHIAIKQGKVAGYNIYAKITGKKEKDFKVKNLAFAIPIGGKFAITKISNFIISGFLGWIAKQLVELYYLTSISNDKFKSFIVWLKGIRIFSKNDI